MQHLLLLLTLALTANAVTDTNYRLNTPIVPASYALTITPYFNTGNSYAFTFDGEVSIKFTTSTVTNQIKLHSEDLTYTASNITITGGITNIQLNATDPLSFDTQYTFALINLQTSLQPGTEYTLNITYRGPIRDDLNGFYRNYYIAENGDKKWLGATQMQPTHARKVFPCFDEPGLKARFTLTIDRPENYKASLANTQLESTTNLSNGYKRDQFYETPTMSTYLVAFLVSEFEVGGHNTNGTKEFGVWSRPEAINQTHYAYDFGFKVVNELSNYFGIDYYSTNEHLKLDHIALPDFRAGAMENWGLIKYREASLLYDPEESTPYYKYRAAQIIAHETTHMWFGNLVTCFWWSNAWLNEGFANYFQDYITAVVEPDVGSADILVTGSVYSAYEADDNGKAAPINNVDVNSPAEISGHFGTITYQKAGSVIRMMHHLLGDDGFKIGLQTYLDTRKFSSGYPDDMYTALEQGVNKTNALVEYPKFTITEIMKSWIEQSGHPLLHVSVDYNNGNVTLTQERFYTNPANSSNETYKIPITYTTGLSPNFTITKPDLVMADKTYSFVIPDLKHNWVIFNIQESGLYRVNYDDMTWTHIISALNGEDRNKIAPLNRAKIINDLFALFFADKVKFKLVNDALNSMKDETDYSVWLAAIRGLNKLRNRFIGTSTVNSIDSKIKTLLDLGINQVGYEVKASESTVQLRNRMQILEFACKVGHSGCVEKMTEVFNNFRNNSNKITPSLRPVAYCQGLKSGNGEDYDFLWKRMATTNVANEARIISDALSCTTNEDKLKQFLVSMNDTESPIRTQDRDVPLSGVLSHFENVELVLEELKDNFDSWSLMYPSMNSPLTTIASALRTEAQLTEFEKWLSSCNKCSADALSAAREGLSGSRNVVSWASDHTDDVESTLKNNVALIAPSINLLALAFIVVTFFKY